MTGEHDTGKLMIDVPELLRKRDAGETRFVFVRDYAGALDDRILGKFGLRRQRAQLVACVRAQAIAVLSRLLARDMVYGTELMTEADAAACAADIVQSHALADAQFFTNQSDVVAGASVQMTDATMDAGIIIANPDHTYVCLWFEQED